MDVSTIGLIEDEDILLDLASFALSHLDHDNADIAHYLEKLEEIEDRVCHEGRSAFLPRERAAVLSRVLHGELGFVGDATVMTHRPTPNSFGCSTAGDRCFRRQRTFNS